MHLQELKAKSPADLLAYAEELEIENVSTPVSYTHLTLPTIYSV